MWGFSDFRPLQREAMHAVLEGRDSLVVLPTGGGKSLCFQAPALVMRSGDGAADANAVSSPAEAGHYDSATVEDENAGYDFATTSGLSSVQPSGSVSAYGSG